MSATAATSRRLRIASLLPSATDIVASLGLSSHLVGVTHECDVPDGCSPGFPLVLTRSLIDYDNDGQGKIDAKVKEAAAESAKAAVCRGPGSCDLADTLADSVESLYPIDREALRLADPTVVLTQDLCGVCAPSTGEVRRALLRRSKSGDGARVISLQPQSLSDVAETFVTVADACGVPERGERMRDEFLSNLRLLRDTVQGAASAAAAGGGSAPEGEEEERVARRPPRVLLLEWLDPPYDGGHWIPSMVQYAGSEYVGIGSQSSPSPATWDGTKSKQVTWEDVYDSDPDVVLVACCGFDLQRNLRDALGASDWLENLRAAKEGRVYACDGNLYFARPGPSLLAGANIAAQCAFEGVDRTVSDAVRTLSFAPKEGAGWAKVDFLNNSGATNDIEDVCSEACWFRLHEDACKAGKMDYIDPATGYHVFTELAHKKRGKCCGSGCRHCPYNHENVRPEMKADKIMQPSFLYERRDKSLFVVPKSSDNCEPSRVKILFFSGGKDSFLALRALVRQGAKDDCVPFGVVLLTTFDASTRIIAHQEVPISTVVKQASALQIPLVGIPMHRASSESYVDRVCRGVELVRSLVGGDKGLTLVFGDLHLGHIKEWRDSALGNLRCELEYPCWKRPYALLLDDLDKSGVRCIVSASSIDAVKEGDVFDRDLYDRALKNGVDAFGEEGEFHTIAQVWDVQRERALGRE